MKEQSQIHDQAETQANADSVSQMASEGQSLSPPPFSLTAGDPAANDPVLQRRPESDDEADEDSEESLEDRLDRIEATYRDMIDNARTLGQDVAADNLERFLAGTGGTKQESVSWLRDFGAVTSAEETNLGRFEDSLDEEALKLDAGEQSSFNDYWDRTFTALPTTELYYASGTSTVTSTGEFTLSRNGSIVIIEGTVTHRWHDPYDWHAGLGALIPGSGFISDADALLLQQHRGAASFDMEATWTQTLEGTYTIDSFMYFDDSEYDWSEISE